jgi:hypothetical protein
MITLPKLLHDARARHALEIVLQSGQRPRLQTSSGPAELEDVLSESDLFDALSQVLAPDQQAELAVGNVVEFDLEEHGGWNLVTEPNSDGVVVRGRSRVDLPRPDPAARKASDDALELPPLEPFRPDHDPSPAPQRRAPRSTRFDIGVDYGPGGAPAGGQAGGVRGTAAPAGTAVGSPLGPPPTVGDLHSIDDGDLEFALVPGPERELPSPAPVGRDDLAQLVGALLPGTLCLVRTEGDIEEIAALLPTDPIEIIDEANVSVVLALGLAELPPRATWIVRLEDPSRCLAFCLRRMEEGARVLVETRARTGAGAVRGLIGAAPATLVQWLGAHRRRFLSRADRGWRLDDV